MSCNPSNSPFDFRVSRRPRVLMVRCVAHPQGSHAYHRSSAAIDNVPPTFSESRPPAGIPFSYNDPTKPSELNPPTRPPAISPANPPQAAPVPMQVVRQPKITAASVDMNQMYWNLLEIKGTVWQNYMLVMTQWPTEISPEQPDNTGAPFPSDASNLSNTTMETYFQQDTSCMNCHQVSNAKGRDFVMFVTFDAFRGGVPTPAAPFSERVSGTAASAPGQALGNDPMIRSLIEFFDKRGKP